MDRARLLELDAMLDSSHPLVPQLLPLSVVVAALWAGPWALLPLISGPLFGGLPKVMPRMRKPEFALMTAMLVFITTLSVSISQTGGVRSPLIFWVVFYMVGAAARFARRALAFVTAYGVAASVIAVLAAAPDPIGTDAPALFALVCVALVSGRYTPPCSARTPAPSS